MTVSMITSLLYWMQCAFCSPCFLHCPFLIGIREVAITSLNKLEHVVATLVARVFLVWESHVADTMCSCFQDSLHPMIMWQGFTANQTLS
jgi:hypothetical protein